MYDKIEINFNGINIESLTTLINDFVKIIIKNSNDVVLSLNTYTINYDIELTKNKKKYYIQIEDIDKNLLTEKNFIINLPIDYQFKYTYFKNSLSKSIIIFKESNYLSVIYLGLPNKKSSESFQIDYNYNKIGSINNNTFSSEQDYCVNCSGTYDGSKIVYLTLFNNYFGINNYFLNTLKFPGDITQICIANETGITSYDSLTGTTNKYELFKIKNIMNITINTNIYFNDSTTNPNPISYIINLNNYNFTEFKNIPEKYENLILCISFIDSNENLFQSILSLNLQTFNPEELCDLEYQNINYYNVLFFFNYVNNGYDVDFIDMFNYDYEKYFLNTTKPIELFNINTYNIDLYTTIILSDTNLSIPYILDISKPYLFVNLDLLELEKKLINPLFANNYFYKFTKSDKINFEVILTYLLNFIIKKYNIYKISNNENIDLLPISTNNKIIQIKNYIYDNNFNYNPKINTFFNKKINFNNNIVNCIRSKIIFNFKSNTNFKLNGTYTFDGKLFLNNYNLEIYHKEYLFENNINDEQKKKLLKMLLLLAMTTTQIKLYFFYKKNSVVTAYYLFNQVNIYKNSNDFNIELDISPLNNTYTQGYIQMDIKINIQYYLLFLYIDSDSFLNSSTFDELIFYHNNYIFKILRIDSPNGNQDIDKQLYYICFQNLKELNIFMKFIETGTLDLNILDKNLSNYFNINKSISFYNYYDLNNYWIIDDSPIIFNSSQSINRYKIFFSINNLSVNQIYLYGDLFIKSVN